MYSRLFVSLALVIVGGVGHAIQECAPDVPVLDRNEMTVTHDGHRIDIGGVNEWSCTDR